MTEIMAAGLGMPIGKNLATRTGGQIAVNRGLPGPDARTIPIIALTANAFAEDISRTAQAGMNAHLSKPINIELLCATLLKLLSEKEGAQKTSTDEE